MDLEFLPNDADEDEGLSEAGIETFRDAPYASVARECGQNSRDAAAKTPVLLTFNKIEIDVDDIPSIESFRSAVKSCLSRAKDSKDPKELRFFQNAQQILSGNKISALEISDYGTRGVIGPCKPGSPFHSLLKGAGVSVKDSITSGGSFGIGKKAAFAVSDLHTVFYSTSYPADSTSHFLAQGKCNLVSHVDASGTNRRATGYWGTARFMPVQKPHLAPAWLRRKETGTSTVSLGFRAVTNWSCRVAESLIRNFFASIMRGEMEFSVDNAKISITGETLPLLFSDPQVREAAEESGGAGDLDFARHAYECLRSENSFREEFTISDLGAFKLTVLVDNSLPKRVAILRNGMFITDNLHHFGDRLSRFAMYKDFVAVLEPSDRSSNEAIKHLENPKHDELSAERIQDEAGKRKIRRAMIELKNRIREGIKKHAVSISEDSEQIIELNEFFSGSPSEERPADPRTDELNPERRRLEPVLPIRRHPPADGSGDTGGGRAGAGRSSGGNGGAGSGTGGGIGGSGDRGEKGLVRIHDLRILDGETRNSVEVLLTPSETIAARLFVHAFGLSEDVPLKLLKIDGRPFSQTSQLLQLTSDERLRLHLELEDEYHGPVEVYFKKQAPERSQS